MECSGGHMLVGAGAVLQHAFPWLVVTAPHSQYHARCMLLRVQWKRSTKKSVPGAVCPGG
eukprot:3940792-Rhodomonas_salina.1